MIAAHAEFMENIKRALKCIDGANWYIILITIIPLRRM